MSQLTIEVDDELLAAVRSELSTAVLDETVRASLPEAVKLARRRSFAAAVRTGEFDLLEREQTPDSVESATQAGRHFATARNWGATEDAERRHRAEKADPRCASPTHRRPSMDEATARRLRAEFFEAIDTGAIDLTYDARDADNKQG